MTSATYGLHIRSLLSDNQARVEDAAAARVQAMSDRAHSQTKLGEEQKKVERVKEDCEIVQKEYEVRVRICACLGRGADRARLGVAREGA